MAFYLFPINGTKSVLRLQLEQIVDKFLQEEWGILVDPFSPLLRFHHKLQKFLLISYVVYSKWKLSVGKLICDDPKSPKISMTFAFDS
jgi:hypothetical protein